MSLERLRGVRSRFFDSPLEQALNPFININNVIALSKSPRENIRLTAIANLTGRLKHDEIAPATALDLLTHPVNSVAAAAVDHVIAKGLKVPDIYEMAFVTALASNETDAIARKMELKNFPPEILVHLASDGGLTLSCLAMEALASRIIVKNIEPRQLKSLDAETAANLIRCPDFKPEDRVFVMEGAISVHREIEQGWENTGYYMYQPGDFQTRSALKDHQAATTLLKAALGTTRDPDKQYLLDKLIASNKLGKFVYFDRKTDGWDGWKFSGRTIKEGQDLVYEALGPQYPFKIEKEDI
jgi:hypothetical protein